MCIETKNFPDTLQYSQTSHMCACSIPVSSCQHPMQAEHLLVSGDHTHTLSICC